MLSFSVWVVMTRKVSHTTFPFTYLIDRHRYGIYIFDKASKSLLRAVYWRANWFIFPTPPTSPTILMKYIELFSNLFLSSLLTFFLKLQSVQAWHANLLCWNNEETMRGRKEGWIESNTRYKFPLERGNNLCTSDLGVVHEATGLIVLFASEKC